MSKYGEAWDDGYQAGHEDARAVQSTYPDPTPNPHRVTPPAEREHQPPLDRCPACGVLWARWTVIEGDQVDTPTSVETAALTCSCGKRAGHPGCPEGRPPHHPDPGDTNA